MAQNFIECDRDQPMLLPPDLRDWLAEDHLAWFVLDAVSELDLTSFFSDYRSDGWGRAAHDPEMMVALLLYAYATGERSSRGIERKLTDDVAFRVIAANQRPDHATLARFRARHEDALSGLFSSVLSLCAEAGLVSVGTLALDGTRVRADAADRQNRSYDQIADEILAEAAETDAAEDVEHGDARGDELPGDRRSRRERLREAKRRLDEAHRAKQDEMAAWAEAKAEYTERIGFKERGGPKKPRPVRPISESKTNVTDPDSRPVKTARGFIQGYTAQAAAAEGQVIVAAEVITGGNERHRLEPMARAAEAELKRGRGHREDNDRPRRRRLLELAPDRGARGRGHPRPLPARCRHPQSSDQDPLGSRLRVDARATQRARSRRGLPATTTDRRAGLCPDQVEAARLKIHAPRVSCLPRRMAPYGRDPQPAEALFRRFAGPGGLIGRLRPSIARSASDSDRSARLFATACMQSDLGASRPKRLDQSRVTAKIVIAIHPSKSAVRFGWSPIHELRSNGSRQVATLLGSWRRRAS
ncbi:MAG: transposase [Actinomycetota bacterium]|nr:transposase [Actinomycetota bacterium]